MRDDSDDTSRRPVTGKLTAAIRPDSPRSFSPITSRLVAFAVLACGVCGTLDDRLSGKPNGVPRGMFGGTARLFGQETPPPSPQPSLPSSSQRNQDGSKPETEAAPEAPSKEASIPANSTASKSTASKSTASKSTPAKSTAAKPTAAKPTPAKSTASKSGATRPNIILMMSDDQGWSGLSVAMHPDYAGSKGAVFQTPNLERFASQGMRFSSGYAPAPVCSPTRISIQTGKSPAKLHWTKAAPAETGRKLVEPTLIKRIADSETTIGELLRTAGYATAHYGKWHISGGGPGEHGYDEHDGDTGNENAYQFTDPNPVDIFGMAQH